MTLNAQFKPERWAIRRGYRAAISSLGVTLLGSMLVSNIVWAGPNDFFKPQHITGVSSANDGADEVVDTPVKKKKFSYSFAKYKKMIGDVCKGLATDGRQVKFFQMLDEHDVRNPECPACKPLISSFSVSCRAAKPVKAQIPKKAKHVEEPTPQEAEPQEIVSHEPEASPAEGEKDKEPEPQKVFLQREPNVIVIQGLSQIFGSMAEDEEWIDENAKAVDRIVKILREKGGKTPAEVDYYDFMSQYIMAPFTEYFEKKIPKEQHEGGSGTKEAPTQSVDSLFE